MVYINNGEHDNPNELTTENLESLINTDNTVYTHIDFGTKLLEEIEKLEYVYQHFQDNEKVLKTDPQVLIENTDNTLYPHINNNIEYGLFENVIVIF